MKEKKKPSKAKFIIEGLKDDNKIFWKNHIPCICNGIHDLRNCKRCKYEKQENSIPRETFEVIQDGKKVQVEKIKIVRGKDEDVIGWSW